MQSHGQYKTDEGPHVAAQDASVLAMTYDIVLALQL
jgi:hypothetical protein